MWEMTERFDTQPEHPLPQAPAVPVPGGHARRSRFRWWIITVPLTCALGVWAYAAVDPGWRWDRQMARWHVVHRNRFTALVVLSVVLLTVTACVHVVRSRSTED